MNSESLWERREWTHLKVFDVSMWGGGPDLLHHSCHQEIGLKLPAAELPATLWAGHWPVCCSPVPGDAGFTEVMHAGQHDRLVEQVTANGTRQILPQAALGGWRSRGCRSHGVGSFTLESLWKKPRMEWCYQYLKCNKTVIHKCVFMCHIAGNICEHPAVSYHCIFYTLYFYFKSLHSVNSN